MTPQQLGGRMGAYRRWSKTAPGSLERREQATKMRRGFLKRFESEPDPEAALRAYMLELALKRQQGRRRRAA